MRWTIRIGFLLALAWAAFIISPFLALYRLNQAVQARDVAAINELVNFPALRSSLSQQIVADYLARSGRKQQLSELGRQVAAGAGASIADSLLARYVTAEAVLDLLARGSLPVEGAAPGTTGSALGPNSLEGLWRIYANSETHGFRRVVVYMANPEKPDERFGLTMRLKDWAWRLSGIELPASVRARLVDELPKESG